MKFHPSLGLTAALSFAAVSCYPIDYYERDKANRGPQKKTAQKTETKEDELRKKQEEELKKAGQENNLPPDNTTTQNTAPGNTTTTPGTTERRTDYPFANKVPGKDGFVFSPYNNKVVDVRDIPSGTLVQDPTYPASEKKYFRVP
ncbi:MAG TPA: hypothetical protein VLO11_11435 [Luteolibacter sp.]|nr:hypothetical protein [Luteolibacter sp.]